MKKIIFTLAAAVAIVSCSEKNPIGDPIEITLDRYTLPEQGASQWANDYIVDLFNETGTVITYHPTQADFTWSYGAAQMTHNPDSIFVGEGQYVEPLLRFIDETWLSRLTAQERKELPYRIFLADSITGFAGQTRVKRDFAFGYNSIALSGVNAKFGQMTTAERNLLASNLLSAVMPFPTEEFNAVTDWDGLRAMGFPANTVKFAAGVLPRRTANLYYNPDYNPYLWLWQDWWTGPFWTPPGDTSGVQTSDKCRAFDREMFYEALSTWPDNSLVLEGYGNPGVPLATFLDTYPKIKAKWDIMLNYYKDILGIDLRAMANATE